MKKWTYSLLALVMASSVALGLIAQTSALLPLINQSFLFGLFFVIFGCIALVIRSGFFTAFARGLQQLKELFFRKPRVLDSDLYSADDPSFQRKKEAILRTGTSLFLVSGFGMILFSLVLTCFYYA
ncbi:DUF3899 domain-containing protein [Brevibacillus choshinensis]|uniref:DUF3899 domain-containing protein n=1 Tax=Brevibacillus choshinensis TaxID=54911 RepID=A0ABX7FTF1_BRECH|nr:DUF3899 domain-containing protein [Brevibacillus choshinensis]QRG69356.1 DUF3899 domain-containing protein [Brevibacillus choshinensis]